MREIKFRGIMTEHSRLISNPNEIWIKGEYFNTWINGECKSHIMCVHENDNIKHWSYSREIIPETVGQFTDHLDKNLKEIYEGDIVKSWIFVDVLPTGEAQWEECEKPYVIDWHIDTGGFDLNDDKYEIIGNIHENPELME